MENDGSHTRLKVIQRAMKWSNEETEEFFNKLCDYCYNIDEESEINMKQILNIIVYAMT